MKTNHSPRAQLQSGNTLLMTVVVTGILGFILAAYLTLVNSQNGSNMRSQSWNSAMPIVEAGLEEALAHLNSHGVAGQNLAVDGWTQSGSVYTVTRNLAGAVYTVTITNYVAGNPALTPIVESRGYVVMPLQLTSAQGALLAEVTGGTSPYTTINYLGRGVRVRTRRDAIFAKGMVAKDTIDMKGNNIRTDSFDSTNPLYSTNGMYIPAKARANGDIAVNGNPTNGAGGVVNVGNANIYGHVSTGPNGTIDIGAQGSVGDFTWQASNKGIQPGWSASDMNVSFSDVEVPYSGGYTPTGGYFSVVQTVTPPVSTGGRVVRTNVVTTSILPVGTPPPILTNGTGLNKKYTYTAYTYITPTNSGTYYDYVLWSENYQVPNLNGKVLVLGDAKLYTSTGCNIAGLLVEWGKHLDLYSDAPSVSLVGNDTANSDATADSFAFWGTTNVTKVTFTGNSSFTGTIYAPNADFTLNGSGVDTIDFTGASITKSVTLNGHFNFHYDESLAIYGPSRGFIVTSWSEMIPAEVPKLTTTVATQTQ
jgi:hypothetical protein